MGLEQTGLGDRSNGFATEGTKGSEILNLFLRALRLFAAKMDWVWRQVGYLFDPGRIQTKAALATKSRKDCLSCHGEVRRAYRRGEDWAGRPKSFCDSLWPKWIGPGGKSGNPLPSASPDN